MQFVSFFLREISTVVRGNCSRQITLMNLCGVLVVANIIFLFGVDKTEPKVISSTYSHTILQVICLTMHWLGNNLLELSSLNINFF